MVTVIQAGWEGVDLRRIFLAPVDSGQGCTRAPPVFPRKGSKISLVGTFIIFVGQPGFSSPACRVPYRPIPFPP
jgi:hypothetical protein